MVNSMDLKTRLEWMLHDAESNLTKNPVKKALHRVKMKELEVMTEKRLSIRMPKDLHREFKATTAKQGLSMGDVLNALVKEYVDGKFQITPDKSNKGEGE